MRRVTARVIAATLLLLPGVALALPSALEIQAKIERDSARVVIGEIMSDRTLGDYVFRSIARGSLAWLDIALLLKPAADAGAATLLDHAVGAALQKAPTRVLPLVDSGTFRPQDACLPRLSDDLPAAQAIKVVRATESVLARVNDPKLASAKAKCLAVAAETRMALERRTQGERPDARAADKPQAGGAAAAKGR